MRGQTGRGGGGKDGSYLGREFLCLRVGVLDEVHHHAVEVIAKLPGAPAEQELDVHVEPLLVSGQTGRKGGKDGSYLDVHMEPLVDVVKLISSRLELEGRLPLCAFEVLNTPVKSCAAASSCTW